MRLGLRMVCAALVAGLLAVSTPAALAKGPSTRKPPPGPKVPALVTDLARIEPLALPAAPAEDGPTVALDGVGEYRGALELRRTPGGVGAVNDVALEDYLKGISEAPSSWPAEALRAQAIAARTYLLWTLGRPPGGDAAALGAQICATDSCQVYGGVAKERAPNGANWAAAVHDTAGQAREAALRLSNARSVCVLTGSGISAESGLPTFRGVGGLWRTHRVEELASPTGFARDPVLVWTWYNERRAAHSRIFAACFVSCDDNHNGRSGGFRRRLILRLRSTMRPFLTT